MATATLIFTAHLMGPAMKNGMFQFTVSAPSCTYFVIESSPDLQNWTPVCTNTISNGSFEFSEPAGSEGNKFYRVKSPE